MINATAFARFAADPAAFRDELIVDVDGVARKFGKVQDDWQRADFAAIDPALMLCNGRAKADESVRSRAFIERPRGHSKTTDLAVTCVYALAFATRPIRGYCYAADRDQAALLKDAMATICRLNPWLGEILDVQKGCVTNVANGHPGQGGTLTIEASNVASSYGILPDLIIADELSHWEGDGSLWHSLISSAAKRSTCLLVVITNAGFTDSWQWAVRESARADDEAWYFTTLDGPHASWMTEKRLAEQRRMLPAVAFARLWLNQWSSGGGDALTPEDIEAAFHDDLAPLTGKQPGYKYVAGVDLGLVRDCSAVVVLAVPDGGVSGRIRLAHTRLWRPALGRKIEIMEIEQHLLELDKLFGLEFVAFDPWQAEHMAQRLEADSGRRRRNERRKFYRDPWMQAVPPTAANLRDQAGLTIESFKDRRLILYPEDELRRDLTRLRVEETSYGYRLSSPRDHTGHGDTFSAFALALKIGHEVAGKKRVTVGFSKSGVTAQQRAMATFERRKHEYEQEMEKLDAPDDGLDDWRFVMRAVGRL
ncbi:MAG: terminase large subunit [Planctomycetaceae bacterium]